MNYEFQQSIERANFSPTDEAEVFEGVIKPKLGMKHRYEVAQLMIGRSLAEPQPPIALPPASKFGKPIKGDQLFTDHLQVWMAILIIDGRFGSGATIEGFKQLVESHWARGAKLLSDDWEHSRHERALFAKRVAEMLPDSLVRGPVRSENDGLSRDGPIRLKPGAIGLTHPGGEPASFVVNGPSVSPHIALMGKSGSGKTRTGIQILRQLADQSSAPFLFIDPKGEFVEDGRLRGELTEFGRKPEVIEVGHIPVPLDFAPDLSAGRMAAQNAARQLTETITKCCKGAGQVQKSRLLNVIEGAFEQGLKNLSDLAKRYRIALDNEGKNPDSVMAMLDSLSTYGNGCFSPKQSPSEFFSKSWVISLKSLPDDLRPLCVLVLLDVLKTYLRGQNEAAAPGGFRTLKHVLMLDEARKFLKEARSESLVEIVREMRSKGSCVILLSQDPSDFEGEQDDFTTQLGAVIGFSCNQSKSGLKSLKGIFGRALQEREFSDTTLPPGVAFCKLPQRQPEQIRCWLPQ